jgi:thioredoxin-related protein
VTAAARFALAALCALFWLDASGVESSGDDPLSFDDRPLDQDIVLPEWFKLSFLELHDDLREAAQAGKRGLIIYFGQKDCPYCKAHLEKNWARPDVVAYTREFFDVVAVDVKGGRLVTDLDGSVRSEKEYAIHHRTHFTPSFLFIDRDGEVAFRLSGYHPPYEFRAALEFVADEHYRAEGFREYLARAEPALRMDDETLNAEPFFGAPPHALDRSRFPAGQPLAVFFERPQCHACDVLHGGPLRTPQIVEALRGFEVVQLDMESDTPVLLPTGERGTAGAWAQSLGLFYAPTIVFFDERGGEIIRVDSLVQFYRLRGVLRYVAEGGYREYDSYQQWRQAGRPAVP